MSLNASKVKNTASNKVEQPDWEPGNYPVRLVQLIDIGLQPQKPHMGKEKPPINKVMMTYEFVDYFMLDENGKELEDKPRWLSEQIPIHKWPEAEKAKSTNRINGLDPKGDAEGDLIRLVGSPAMATVVLNESKGKLYGNIAGLAPMRARDAMNCPELKNPTKVFDLSEPDVEVFNSLPEWIQTIIKENLNYAGSKLEAALAGKGNDTVQEKQEKAESRSKAAKPAVSNEVAETDNSDSDVPW